MSLRTMPAPVNPVLIQHEAMRDESRQDRIADAITKFSGSMPFIYIHIVWFALWTGLRVEKFPFGLLTMLVSLEAIFLSTFVLISQNRADERRQLLADSEYTVVQTEERQNEELLELSRQILDLTKEIHKLTTSGQA
jgi:uncharacterized membrane protein